jgi:bla regulator protein BlaR1
MLSLLGNLERVFTWVLTASLYASVVVVLVLVVQGVFRHRLPARWRYLLWSLVLVRLVLPSVPESRLSIFNLVKFNISETAKRSQVDRRSLSANDPHRDALPEQATTISFSETEHPSMVKADNFSQDGTSSTKGAQTQQSAGMQSEERANGELQSAADSPHNWFSWDSYRRPVSVLWTFGFVFLLARAVLGHVRIRTRLLRLTKVADPVVLALLETCQIEMDVSWKISLLETDEDRSPAIFGLWRPQLILPKRLLNELSQEELRFVLLHELGHVRRQDLFVNCVLICLQAFHWFNPVIWLACRRMRSDQELACDALVLSRLKVHENLSYGETIVKLLESLTTHRSAPAALGILENKSAMKLRLIMIGRFRKATYVQMILAMSVFLGLTAIGLTNAKGEAAKVDALVPEDEQVTMATEQPKTASRIATAKDEEQPPVLAGIAEVPGLDLSPNEKQLVSVAGVFEKKISSGEFGSWEFGTEIRVEFSITGWLPNISSNDPLPVLESVPDLIR